MIGILKLGYKLLINDKAKFATLLIGTAFAVFLMAQTTPMVGKKPERRIP